jgi:hypothetical protein
VEINEEAWSKMKTEEIKSIKSELIKETEKTRKVYKL